MGYLVKQFWTCARNVVGSFLDDLDQIANNTGLNSLLSFTFSIPDNLINHTTTSKLSVLNNNYTIIAPVNQDISNTPTVSEFLNAANTEYAITGTPDGMRPF